MSHLDFIDLNDSQRQRLQKIMPVSRETIEKYQIYVSLLHKWQKKINLVATTTLPDVWERHIIDSLQIIPICTSLSYEERGDQKDLSMIDFGSGAGFPGMVVAISGGFDVHLMEADTRKTAFLREVARQTETKITCHNQRIEAIPPFPVDIITARGFASVDKILQFGAAFSQSSTKYILLKGEKYFDEIKMCQDNWTMIQKTTPSVSDPRGVIVTLEKVTQK